MTQRAMTQRALTRRRRLPLSLMAAALSLVTAFAIVQVPSARADDFDHGNGRDHRDERDRGHERDHRDEHERGHERDHGHERVVVRHDRDIQVVPRTVYAPPPVVYAPPVPTEGINLVFPLHIR